MGVKVTYGGHTHKQDEASDTWIIEHNLGRDVVVDVMVDIVGQLQKMLPLSVEKVDENRTRVTFTQPRTGQARIA